ncbi:MAG TPA: stage III sporulation protein AD [Candidatus Deferrimicrobium sp.]|nr:stage III sporulation protein AD [Candidatus Deferrimicrobium sp.]
MEIMQIVGLALVATILVVIIKNQRPELALQLSIVTGVIIFLLVVTKIKVVLDVLNDLALHAQVNSYYLTTVLKIVGVAYIAEFGAQICRDAGEGAIATKVEFAAKILVMVLALPIIVAVMESIIRLIP